MEGKEIPDGTTDKMRQVVSSLENIEALVEELAQVPTDQVRLWQRPAYWLAMRRLRKEIHRMSVDARVMEAVARAAEWEMPVALTPE